MADITKKVDRGVPPTERMVSFTDADAGAGDVLMVYESLGGPAASITIEAGGAMTVRFNVYREVYPRRPGNDFMYSSGHDNISLGERIKDNAAHLVSVGAGETWSNDGEFPVKDIELDTVSGTFDILCTK